MKQQSTKVNYVHQYWTAAFIDLLGQKDLFKKIDYIPREGDSMNREEFTHNLLNAYGRMKFISDQIYELSNTLKGPQNRLSLDAHQQTLYKTMKSPQVQIQKFSDGALVYYPMGDHSSYSIPNAINDIISLSGLLMLGSLAAEIPLRIGIAIGAGALIDNQLFGPVIANAYDMESQVAQFPRAVIHEKVIGLLKGEASKDISNITSNKGRYDREISERCLDYVEKDGDGHWFVDYLSHQFKAAVGATKESHETLTGLIKYAYDFICSEHKRLSEKEDSCLQESCHTKSTLPERYARLKQYFVVNSD